MKIYFHFLWLVTMVYNTRSSSLGCLKFLTFKMKFSVRWDRWWSLSLWLHLEEVGIVFTKRVESFCHLVIIYLIKTSIWVLSCPDLMYMMMIIIVIYVHIFCCQIVLTKGRIFHTWIYSKLTFIHFTPNHIRISKRILNLWFGYLIFCNQ